MSRSHFALKLLVLVVVCAYFAYALYWLVKTVPWIVEISLNLESYSPATGFRFIDSQSVSAAYLMEYSGFFGLIIRVVGASCALLATLLILKNGAQAFPAVRGKISLALFLEGSYFLSLVPAVYFLLLFSALPAVSNFLLSTAILCQILLISPVLFTLGFKVRKSEHGAKAPLLLRLAALAAMNYVIAIWVTYMLKWTEMTAVDPYLFSAFSVRILGFLNTVIVQSLAVAFAVIGFLYILKKNGRASAIRLWGLSLIFLSLHTIIYVVYVTSVGIPRFIPFGELWLIPFLAFGLYLLLKNPNVKLAP